MPPRPGWDRILNHRKGSGFFEMSSKLDIKLARPRPLMLGFQVSFDLSLDCITCEWVTETTPWIYLCCADNSQIYAVYHGRCSSSFRLMCHLPATRQIVSDGAASQATYSSMYTTRNRSGKAAQWAQCLSSKHKTLSLIPDLGIEGQEIQKFKIILHSKFEATWIAWDPVSN